MSLFATWFIICIWFQRNKSIAYIIKLHYSLHTLQLFSEAESLSRRSTKAKLDGNFLNVCKAYHYVPKFMQFKLFRRSLEHTSFNKSWTSNLLDNEIRNKQKLCDGVNSELLVLKTQVRHCISIFDIICLSYIISLNINKFTNLISNCHSDKIYK